MSTRKRKCEAEIGELGRPPLGLRKYVNGELVSAIVGKRAICRCGDQAGVALKIIRHGFENRPSAKMHDESYFISIRITPRARAI